MFNAIRKDIKTFKDMTRSLLNAEEATQTSKSNVSKIMAKMMAREYDGPGHISVSGARHSNGESFVLLSLTTDHANIAKISIPPPNAEMTADREPYIPFNLVDAPHHLHENTAKM